MKKIQPQSEKKPKPNPIERFGKKLKQFPKGVSGNPGGKPKVHQTLTMHLRDVIEEESTASEHVQKFRQKDKVGKHIARGIASEAMKGDVRAAEFIANRLEGSVEQKIRADVSGETVREIRIVVDDEKAKNVLGLAARLGILTAGAGGDGHAGGTGGNGSAPAPAVPEARAARPDGKADRLPPSPDKPNP